MSMIQSFPFSLVWNRLRAGGAFIALLGTALLVACSGGGGGGGSSPPTTVAAAPIIVSQPQSVRVSDGQAASFSATAVSSTTLSYQWFRAGAAIAGANSATYTLSPAQLSDDGATFTVSISNASGTVQSSAATLNVSPAGPSIANNVPRTISVVVGQPATFTVAATGTAPLTFQWRRGGVPIAGANAATYTIPVTALSDNGSTFDVVVSNPVGTIASALITLNVTSQAQAPSITTQPQSQSIRAGNPVTFAVIAAGTSPFAYQWFRNGVAIPGAQSFSFTIAATTPADSGATFNVTVSNAAGSVSSSTATLTILPSSSLALVAGNIGGPGSIDGTGSAARFLSPTGVALDNGGNVYVADGTMVRRLTPAGAVTTFAGSPSTGGSTDGAGSAALFGIVAGVAVDPTGNVFVIDSRNHTVRRITPAGTVSTFAGTNGVPGSADGTGTAAAFNLASGIATDTAGNVYVADTGNQTIRKITPAGVVTTLAGSPGVVGSADGSGNAASFSSPTALVVDTASNVYVADLGNSTIRRITAAGVVTTLAGTAGARGSADGTGPAARFNSPTGIAVDAAGNVYVGDGQNRTIRRITPAGVVTTVAGTPLVNGSADGTGAAASFSGATGLASTPGGVLYVADRDNFEVRSISTTAVVTTVAGLPLIAGGADGTGSAATFTIPYGIAIDAAGTLFVSDPGNSTIRRVQSNGVVSTLAGTAGSPGTADGTGPAARFGSVRGTAVDAAGNVYVADYSSNTIRRISAAGVVVTLAGNPLVGGATDGPGSAATFNGPSAVAVDGAGNVFVADSVNSLIRRITPAGVVTTFAGTAGVVGARDGTGAAASFNQPTGITIDAAGNLYVAEGGNGTIRRISAAGIVTTIAGTAGVFGAADGPGPVASFNGPIGISIDRAGNLFVVDTGNRTLRRIDPTGNVSTVAGLANGRRGVRLGSSPGAFSQPLHVVSDGAGTVYVTDAAGILTIAAP